MATAVLVLMFLYVFILCRLYWLWVCVLVGLVALAAVCLSWSWCACSIVATGTTTFFSDPLSSLGGGCRSRVGLMTSSRKAFLSKHHTSESCMLSTAGGYPMNGQHVFWSSQNDHVYKGYQRERWILIWRKITCFLWNQSAINDWLSAINEPHLAGSDGGRSWGLAKLQKLGAGC